MEENKYYTPEISELHVGYQYYLKDKGFHIDDVQTINSLQNMWTLHHLGIENILVPYLTKEQIEAEGWEFVNIDQCFIKNGIKIYFNEERLSILRQPEYLFQGKIKSINEFRTLCKWLGIC